MEGLNEIETTVRINKSSDILETALELFSSRGYNDVGVQEIVTKAHVTKPVLYYFFKNKQGLYLEIWHKYYSPFIKQLEQLSVYNPYPKEYDKDVFPQLCFIAELYYTFEKEYPLFFQLMCSLQFAPESAEGLKDVQSLYQVQFSLMGKFFTCASVYHRGMQGKSSFFSKLFIADVYAGIESRLSYEKIVKIFLHGMFNV